MKKYLLFIVLFFINSLLQAQESVVVPMEAQQFILKGFKVLDFVKGDINKDGKEDAILILKSSLEDAEGDSAVVDTAVFDLLRPMLLLVRNTSNQLELKLRNDSFIMCKGCGGIFGNPYAGIRIYRDTIEVSFYGGSAWRWGETHYFSFNKTNQNWPLIQQQYYTHHTNNLEPEKYEIIKANELQGETLATANYIREDEKDYVVTASKAFFYNNPNLKSKPRKAYLVKGDKVKVSKETKNFIKVYFYNDKEQSTSGYILKKDIQQQ